MLKQIVRRFSSSLRRRGVAVAGAFGFAGIDGGNFVVFQQRETDNCRQGVNAGVERRMVKAIEAFCNRPLGMLAECYGAVVSGL